MKLSEIHIKPLLETLRFEDIDDEVYFSEKYSGYVSNSRLSRINPDQDGSPEKFFNQTLGIYTDSIVFGSAIHELVLQPESFELNEFANRPTAKAGFMADEVFKTYKNNGNIIEAIYKASNKIGYYKDKLTENKINKLIEQCTPYWQDRLKFEQNNTSDKIQIYLDPKSRERLKSCLNAVYKNNAIKDLLNPKGIIEDPEYGYEKAILLDVEVTFDDSSIKPFILRLKSKLDNYTIDRENNTILVNDLKTHGAILPEFDNAVDKYHYYREMAMYSWLLSMVAKKYYNMDNPTIKSNFLVVQTIPEFYTKVSPMTGKLFNLGFDEFKRLLKLVAFYKANGYVL
jgi:hypothetical protein